MDDRQHETIIELIPDYLLGALAAREAAAVAQHLRTCPDCPRYVASLQETLALLGAAELPRPEVRGNLLARVGGRSPNGVAPQASDMPPVAVPGVPPSRSPVGPMPPVREQIPLRSRRRPTWRFALVAVLAGLLLVSGLVNVVQQRRLAQQDQIARLIGNPEAARALTDTDLQTGATGTIYIDPGSAVALVLANRLPPLPSEQRYQVWLFTEDGRRESGGRFAVDADGNGQALIRAPQAFANYWAIGISAEPVGGSDAPTSALALGGWIR